MNDRTGDGTGSFKVEIRMNTAKFTNMIITREGEWCGIDRQRAKCTMQKQPIKQCAQLDVKLCLFRE